MLSVSTVSIPGARRESISHVMNVAAVGGIVPRVLVELYATFSLPSYPQLVVPWLYEGIR